MDSERVRELEQRISDLEAQLSGGWTRRDALKLGGAGTVGALLGGGGAMSAVGQAAAGTYQSGSLGTASNPLDLVVDDITAVDSQGSATRLQIDISGDANTVDGYEIQKDGTDGAGIINFKTV